MADIPTAEDLIRLREVAQAARRASDEALSAIGPAADALAAAKANHERAEAKWIAARQELRSAAMLFCSDTTLVLAAEQAKREGTPNV